MEFETADEGRKIEVRARCVDGSPAYTVETEAED